MASPRKPTKPSRKQRRVSKWRVFLLTSGSILGITLIALLIFVISAVAKTPKWDPAALTNQKESSIVYDKDGQQIAVLHADENRQMVESSEIPDLVKEAFVAVEDKRFYSHFGVDPIRIVGSAIVNIKSGSAKQGASTITTQLAKNAFIEDPTAKTLTRKIQEASLALQLEHEYTKDEILTFYLNQTSFGESSFGIQAASKTYFGKDKLDDLTADEVALLAGLPQAPYGYDPYLHPEAAKNRRTIVLGVMKDAQIITPEEYTQYKDAPFTHVAQVKEHRTSAQNTSVAGSNFKFPYFVDYVIQELQGENYKLSPAQIFNGGLNIYTTVDSKVQEAAEAAFANSANFPQSVDNTPVQGAMTVLDPTTGAVRAVVGGREYTTARGFNRATQATRQPGSTIKPLVVYGPALEKGGFYTGTVLDDMPVSYNAGDGTTWSPVDYDTESSGWKGRITMRYAVENSVNVYAVKLLNLIGIDSGWEFGKKLGLPLENSDRILSLALGTPEVTTLDMASAYGSFANNGVHVTSHAIEKIQDSNGKDIIIPQVTQERVMKETTAYLMNDLLRSVVTNGTGTRAQIGNWAVAGKTGTTSLDPAKYGNKTGSPDAWFAGYTPNYVGIVWMGYDEDPDGKHYLHNVFGGGYPAQIWKQVITKAVEGQPVQTQFKQPAGIVSGAIDAKSGLLPNDLTPSQFIRTEIAAQGDFPTQSSNIWVAKEIDADHPTYLAGDKTRNKVTKVFLNITDRNPSLTWPSDEAPYKPPTEIYSGTGENTSETFPPVGDPLMPIPTLGPVAYDSAKGTASMAVSYPAGSESLSLVLYIKFPGQTNYQSFNPQAQPGKSDFITVPLQIDGETAPGEYIFKAAFKDPKTLKYSDTSPVARLTIQDQTQDKNKEKPKQR